MAVDRAEPLWSANAAADASGGRLVGAGGWAANSISIDTRSLQPGALFVALPGETRDGHSFVADAFARGAAAALVAQVPEGLPSSASLLVADDTLAALERMGRTRRAASPARVIGVTGSAGKTSTKEALRIMLSEQGLTHASAASFNNHIGTPLTMARMPADSEFAVIEIGMNHAGEIRALVPVARPHAAIVTTIAAAHLENFGSLEKIADAKAEIFEGLVPGGAAVINADNPYCHRLKSHAQRLDARIVTFGRSEAASVRLLDVRSYGGFSECQIAIDGTLIRYRLASPGAHLALNSAAALAAVWAIGADPVRAAAALSAFKPVSGRGDRQVILGPTGAFTLINESYNANPASMAAAFALLAIQPVGEGGRRIAVLGDMLELGASSPQLHASLSAGIDAEGIDAVFACGAMMRNLWDALDSAKRGHYAADAEELARILPDEVRSGDVVMVKGSNGLKMIRVVDALRRLQRAAS
ncbi:MAG TPA: UDP-N-acetylmuramoylalanyl-D-glutamyl-2,6-diaminopimelate--D-alanyl-D-alanine ligase [Alphaproteobacteria bacterium]|nr:UDP-N-acetylmuramoylalanyl-D-glutamyl-2,6-diaminopimelate--D-alanyl-D-alanine ligase [Alphaproteobacteria bacterium]HAJ48401.1 UDP-N-acetylmuramoylalanyl-D-glutamyl-2,6-diaminopimelate--D-alanyl-D-alanine ligase [Alphaproteobacteria bacterium]